MNEMTQPDAPVGLTSSTFPIIYLPSHACLLWGANEVIMIGETVLNIYVVLITQYNKLATSWCHKNAV